MPTWLVPLLPLVATGLAWWITRDRVEHFPDLPEPLSADRLPSVCLCMPVRNEADEVGTALDSWVAQGADQLRIVVVDDGSTDGSTELLRTRAEAHPTRLRVLRNDTLPPGWLGKNHALHLATQQPEALEAEWLLFADADIHADPSLLGRAFAHLEVAGGDFLALWPAMRAAGFWERAVVPLAGLTILWGVPPRRVLDPASPFAFAAGAFILVKREAYQAIGGHAAAPLEAIDDVGLALRLKQAGYRNALAVGAPWLWYRPTHGFGELVASLRKNVLGLRWLLPLSPLMAAATLAGFGAPFWLALLGHAWAGLAMWLIVPAIIGLAHARFSRAPSDWLWAFWPLIAVPSLVALALATWDRLRGVNRWRGREVRLA